VFHNHDKIGTKPSVSALWAAGCRSAKLRAAEATPRPESMFRFFLFALLLLTAALPAAPQAKRAALVIGMSDYQHLSSLINPVPDAKAITAELKSHGFEVSEYYNLDRADLPDAREKFKREAAGAEVALV
jgi:caspase domain-containing protein